MTIQEMYQEIKNQQQEDILNGYIDIDIYDDINETMIEVEYTTQLQYKLTLQCATSTSGAKWTLPLVAQSVHFHQWHTKWAQRPKCCIVNKSSGIRYVCPLQSDWVW